MYMCIYMYISICYIYSSKTRILTTETQYVSSADAAFVECGGSFVEIAQRGKLHKYLGRVWPGDLQNRGRSNLSHRLSCEWMKFHQQRDTLMNHKIPLKLRLNLFDTLVSPTILYSLASTPLSEAQLKVLD